MKLRDKAGDTVPEPVTPRPQANIISQRTEVYQVEGNKIQ